MDNLIIFAAFLIAALGLSLIFTKKLIPILRKKKMGQKILEEGPNWHKSKEGTPTMGGLAFILADALMIVVGVIYLAFSEEKNHDIIKLLLVFGFALCCGGIGIIDDLAKFSHGKNQGLKAYEKYLLQLVASAAFLIVGRLTGVIDTQIFIPFVNKSFDIGFFYYPIMLLLLTGIVNSVNLTDGIDGLATSVTVVVMLFISLLSSLTNNSWALISSAVTAGGCLGFLVFNFHPAKVFMGDTGSLFLGGMLIAVMTAVGNPLLTVIMGIIYITETASVILQVGYFKLTHGKRLFKMSPIHHHFEKCGWSEVKIVSVFSALTMLFCAIAYFGIQ